MFALSKIGGRELPVLRRLVEPLQEALSLLAPRHVEEELADDDAVVRQILFEVADVLRSLLPDALVDHGRRQPLTLQQLGMDDLRFVSFRNHQEFNIITRSRNSEDLL